MPESIRAVDNKNQISFDVLKSGQQQQIPLYLTLKSNTLSGKVPLYFQNQVRLKPIQLRDILI